MTTALEAGEGSASCPAPSLPRGKNQYQLYMRLDGHQGQSGQVRKISPPPGFDPRTVQPIASRYTDYATQPTEWGVIFILFRKLCSTIVAVYFEVPKQYVAKRNTGHRAHSSLDLNWHIFHYQHNSLRADTITKFHCNSVKLHNLIHWEIPHILQNLRFHYLSTIHCQSFPPST
jgi:hypothetical protein